MGEIIVQQPVRRAPRVAPIFAIFSLRRHGPSIVGHQTRIALTYEAGCRNEKDLARPHDHELEQPPCSNLNSQKDGSRDPANAIVMLAQDVAETSTSCTNTSSSPGSTTVLSDGKSIFKAPNLYWVVEENCYENAVCPVATWHARDDQKCLILLKGREIQSQTPPPRDPSLTRAGGNHRTTTNYVAFEVDDIWYTAVLAPLTPFREGAASSGSPESTRSAFAMLSALLVSEEILVRFAETLGFNWNYPAIGQGTTGHSSLQYSVIELATQKLVSRIPLEGAVIQHLELLEDDDLDWFDFTLASGATVTAAVLTKMLVALKLLDEILTRSMSASPSVVPATVLLTRTLSSTDDSALGAVIVKATFLISEVVRSINSMTKDPSTQTPLSGLWSQCRLHSGLTPTNGNTLSLWKYLQNSVSVTCVTKFLPESTLPALSKSHLFETHLPHREEMEVSDNTLS